MANAEAQGGAVTAPSKGRIWVGRIVGAIPVLMMAVSAVMKLARVPAVVESWGARFGYSDGSLLTIGLLELACAVLYLVPRTAVLGAILVTGYLGGAVATHVRVGEAAFIAPAIFGVLAWGGLYLRDPRLRALLPFTK
jgi:hypothetical protein